MGNYFGSTKYATDIPEKFLEPREYEVKDEYASVSY
jgi:hypothetical protein